MATRLQIAAGALGIIGCALTAGVLRSRQPEQSAATPDIVIVRAPDTGRSTVPTTQMPAVPTVPTSSTPPVVAAVTALPLPLQEPTLPVTSVDPPEPSEPDGPIEASVVPPGGTIVIDGETYVVTG